MPGAASTRVLHQRLRAVEHVAAAVEGGESQEQLGHCGGGAQVGHAALQRGDVLARQGGAQPARRFPIRAEILEDTAEEAGLAHVDLELRQPEGAQAFDRHGDHLGVALGVGQPHQLHAGLVELAIAADLRLVEAKTLVT